MLNYTVKKLNNSSIFLSLSFFLFLSFSVQMYAQKITVINPSFELPDTGKVKGFDGICSDPSWTVLVDIPGWNVDSPNLTQWDSGVEEDGPTDGTYRGFLMGGDSAIYQTLNRRLLDGDNIVLSVDASNIWLAPSFKMQLYYVDESSERIPIVTEVKTLTSSMELYSISFKASEHQEAIGYQMGILLDNVSSDSASWLGIDNVQLKNDDPRIIEIANYSFEEPDSNKIKGWEGVCSDPAWTNLVDIPGWQSDEDAWDSGIEQQWTPTDGVYTAFFMGQDAGAYNITDYTIREGDEFLLTLDARDIWATDLLEIELFYINDNNERVTMGTADDEITPEMSEHALTASTASYPNSVDHKIGIWIDNVSTSDQSWLAIDNVRLFNLKTTDVAKTETKPNRFALEQNYPNPFNPSTKISFSIKEAGFVKLNIYNLLGQHVATIVNGKLNAGVYERTFNASNLPSGLYLYKLEVGNNVLVNKMMLLK